MLTNRLTSLNFFLLISNTVLSIVFFLFSTQDYQEEQIKQRINLCTHHGAHTHDPKPWDLSSQAPRGKIVLQKCFLNMKALYKMLNLKELNLFQLRYLQTEVYMLN